MFAYCSNNPIIFSDKSGFQPAIMEKGIGGAPGGGGVISSKGLAQLIKGFYYAAIGTIGTIVGISGYKIYRMSKGGKQNIKDTGLIGLSDEEIARRLKDP